MLKSNFTKLESFHQFLPSKGEMKQFVQRFTGAIALKLIQNIKQAFFILL